MGHTCASLNGELLFVWGGTASDNDQQQQQQHQQLQQSTLTSGSEQTMTKRNSDLWIYETLSGYWRHRTCTGECPPYLSSSSSCIIGRRMFIFGGHSTALDDWLNCLYCLNLETFEWTDLGSRALSSEPTKPIRSDKNVSWSHGNKSYVFGGYGWSKTEHLLDILDRQHDFQLTPDFRWPKFGWNNQLVEFDPARNAWRWPRYTGKCPAARAAHSGTLMGDGKFYLFGGRDSQERLNDLYTFDLETFEWTQLAVVESSPESSIHRPINHLLADSDEHHRDQEVAQVVENNRHPEHPEQAQLIDEISQEDVEELLIEDPIPSSSSWTQQRQQRPASSSMVENLINATSGNPAEHVSQSDDDYDDESDDYPHPSHLLERWSLSSSVRLNQLNQTSSLYEEALATDCLNDCDQIIDSSQYVGESHVQEGANEEADQSIAVRADESNDVDLELNDQHQQAVVADDEDSQSKAAQSRMPIGRSFCSFTPISEEEIILYGGVSSQDQNLDDCWKFNIISNMWTHLANFNPKHKKPRLWHSGSKTNQNEVIIIGGSSSDKIDKFCSDVLVVSLEPKSLKRLALDAVSCSIRMKTIQKCNQLPPTICKLVRLRKYVNQRGLK